MPNLGAMAGALFFFSGSLFSSAVVLFSHGATTPVELELRVGVQLVLVSCHLALHGGTMLRLLRLLRLLLALPSMACHCLLKEPVLREARRKGCKGCSLLLQLQARAKQGRKKEESHYVIMVWTSAGAAPNSWCLCQPYSLILLLLLLLLLTTHRYYDYYYDYYYHYYYYYYNIV